MPRFLVLLIYNTLLPIFFVLAFPAWVIKMLKRGGFGTGLMQRFGVFEEELDFEPAGVVYVHAVSVGEVLIALRLIDQWHREHPEDRFVLAPTTSTGHAVAREKAPDCVRVIYSPLDFVGVLRRVFKRFEPKQIVLIEAEAWPNLLNVARKMKIPVGLANARLSPRSERRYKKFSAMVQPLFSMVDQACVQELADQDRWSNVGIVRDRITVTGSIKFDPSGSAKPQKRDEFQAMLSPFGEERKVVMLVSSHAGEERLIGEVIQQAAPEALYVCVPRHAERREEVSADLQAIGYEVSLRSRYQAPTQPESACFVVDSTGELRDWTAHADLVIIGKSFLGEGGQNPTEAIAAKVPVIAGPSMENFEPLVTMLRDSGGLTQCPSEDLIGKIRCLLSDQALIDRQCGSAVSVLEAHEGATIRTVEALRRP